LYSAYAWLVTEVQTVAAVRVGIAETTSPSFDCETSFSGASRGVAALAAGVSAGFGVKRPTREGLPCPSPRAAASLRSRRARMPSRASRAAVLFVQSACHLLRRHLGRRAISHRHSTGAGGRGRSSGRERGGPHLRERRRRSLHSDAERDVRMSAEEMNMPTARKDAARDARDGIRARRLRNDAAGTTARDTEDLLVSAGFTPKPAGHARPSAATPRMPPLKLVSAVEGRYVVYS